MGKRKLPFGYRMEFGVIVHHPLEVPLVEKIFQQYLSGATYSTLVTELRSQPVPYGEGKVWNKNMLARILEDKRYIGESDYPAIISAEVLAEALKKRNYRQRPSQKTEAQKVLRHIYGHKVTEQTEWQVLNLLNRLAESPEMITAPHSKEHLQSEQWQLRRELDGIMAQQPIDEGAAQKLLLAIAAAEYCAIGNEEYETARLQRVFAQCQPMTELDATLLQSSVSAIFTHSNGSLTIRLKNGQVIEGSLE